MKREEFLRSIFAATGVIALSGVSSACSSILDGKSITFSISTDIHQDIMHDAEQRLSSYLNSVEKRAVDFAVDLGDFCFPLESNKSFIDIWKQSPLKRYNVLGNHDMDRGDKDLFMNYVGMESRYYSFDSGDFHFIVLDPNNLYIDGEYIPYKNGNFYKPSEQRGYVDPEQLEWLKTDLKTTDKPTVIFSHQSFENEHACQNREAVRSIFEEANREAGTNRVVASFCGHDHTDYHSEINGIHYIQVNSMSNQWLGEKYKCPERFSDEINKKRPAVQYTAPYKDPLFAVVTIDSDQIKIEGVKSEFIAPTPKDLGVDTSGSKNPLIASIIDRELEI